MSFWFTPSSWLSVCAMSRTTRKEPSTWASKTTCATLATTPIKYASFSILTARKPEPYKFGEWRNATNIPRLMLNVSFQGLIGSTLQKIGRKISNSTTRLRFRKWATSSWRSPRSQWLGAQQKLGANGATARSWETDRWSTSASTSRHTAQPSSTSSAPSGPAKKKTFRHRDLHRPDCPEKNHYCFWETWRIAPNSKLYKIVGEVKGGQKAFRCSLSLKANEVIRPSVLYYSEYYHTCIDVKNIIPKEKIMNKP